MNAATLFSRLTGSALAMRPSAFAGVHRSLQSDGDDSTVSRLASMTDAERAAWRMDRVLQTVGPVAIITMSGVIVKHVPAWALDPYWLCDLDDIEAALKWAAAEKSITKIVIVADSPGGYVVGVPECAELLWQISQEKETVWFSDSMNCSACIYITSQCREGAVTPSADIGSIGTYMVLVEWTKAFEEMGATITLIREGKYKAMGASFKVLTDEEKALLETEVRELNEGFLATVLRARPDVPRENMEGQTFLGKKAIAAGLADGMVQDLDEVVAAILSV